jgi:beta-phosphoglucomutase
MSGKRSSSSPPLAAFSAVFDMDGVIVNNRAYHFRAWETFAREHGLPFDAEHFKNRLFGRVNREILRGLFGRDLDEPTARLYAAEKESLYRKLYAGHVEPARGLVRFLKALEAEGMRMAVATAAPRVNLDFVLEAAGLGEYFDVLVDVGAVRRGKPAPDLYLKAAAMLDRKPGECAAFEDSYPGVESALAAGMRVVAVTTAHTPGELAHAHLVIADFRGLTVDRVRALFLECRRDEEG